MPLEQSATWVDPPNGKVEYCVGNAEILQFFIDQQISPEESFAFHAYKISLMEGCRMSSKVFPLVIQMWENIGNKRFSDFYSFDNNGVCLSHGYSRYENGKATITEEHDQDVSRLVEKTQLIHELAGDYPLYWRILTHDPLPKLLGGTFKG